jgi:hypothetical protein
VELRRSGGAELRRCRPATHQRTGALHFRTRPQNRRTLALPAGARLLFEVDEDAGGESWTALAVVHSDYSWGFTPDESAD